MVVAVAVLAEVVLAVVVLAEVDLVVVVLAEVDLVVVVVLAEVDLAEVVLLDVHDDSVHAAVVPCLSCFNFYDVSCLALLLCS